MLRVGALGLRTRRLRAALSALGIAIGIASMVAVLGISESSQGRPARRSSTGSARTCCRSRPGQTFFGDEADAAGAGAGDGRARRPASRRSPRVAALDATVRRTDLIDPRPRRAGSRSPPPTRRSLDTRRRDAARTGASSTPRTARYPAVVLGATAAERLGIDDDRRRACASAAAGSRSSGILEPLALAPDARRRGARSASPSPSGCSARTATRRRSTSARTRTRSSDVARRCSARRRTRSARRRSRSRGPSDALEARAAAKTAFTSLFLGLGAVALLVGGVGIANVMVISVLERRSEVGLRRALGATRRHVGAQFLVRVAAAGGGGRGASGVALGAAGDRRLRGEPRLDAGRAAGALAGGLGGGAADRRGRAGLLPGAAGRAARADGRAAGRRAWSIGAECHASCGHRGWSAGPYPRKRAVHPGKSSPGDRDRAVAVAIVPSTRISSPSARSTSSVLPASRCSSKRDVRRRCS